MSGADDEIRRRDSKDDTDVAAPDITTGGVASSASPHAAEAEEASSPPYSYRPADPAALRLRGDPPRVMRLSRKAVAGLGAVAALGVGVALIVALRDRQPAPPAELYSTERRPVAERVTRGPRDYSEAPPPVLGPPLPGDLGGPIVSAQERGVDVMPPAMGGPGASAPQTPAEQAAVREAQAREAAILSGLFAAARPSSASGAGQGLAAASTQGAADPILSGGPQAAAAPGAADDRRAFLDRAPDYRTASVERLAPPVSPYVVQAGNVISAALITGLRSDLPGQVTAQVTEHVYDSPTGRILLIPQGSRLIGDYDASVRFGDRRVLLAWNRLILPDGRSIVLERLPAGDAAGHAGLEDRVDEHWGGLARAAGLSTLLSIGTELGVDGNDALAQAIRRGGQDVFNQAGQEIVRRQLAVRPTLTVRPGFPVRVMVSIDLVLEPWERR